MTTQNSTVGDQRVRHSWYVRAAKWTMLAIVFVLLATASQAVIKDPQSPADPLLDAIAIALDEKNIDVRRRWLGSVSPDPNRPQLSRLSGYPAGVPAPLSQGWMSDFEKGVGFYDALLVVETAEPQRPSTASEFLEVWDATPSERRVFVSYTRADAAHASVIRAALEERGYTVFTYRSGANSPPTMDPIVVGRLFRTAGQHLVLDTTNSRRSLGVSLEAHSLDVIESRERALASEIRTEFDRRFGFSNSWVLKDHAESVRELLVRDAMQEPDPSSRREALTGLLDSVRRLSIDPGPDASNALARLEADSLRTNSSAHAIRLEIDRTLEASRTTTWGQVRGLVGDAIANRELNLNATQIDAWARIFGRWQEREREIVEELARSGNGRAITESRTLDAPFTQMLRRDHELAGIWGFAAKSFISGMAEEGYYRRQFEALNTVEKVRRAELSSIIYFGVIVPAMQSGIAQSLEDGVRKLQIGLLDPHIDFDRIERAIRERGMIPAFGLEYYFLDSGTGTRDDANRIMRTQTWDRTIDEFCQ